MRWHAARASAVFAILRREERPDEEAPQGARDGACSKQKNQTRGLKARRIRTFAAGSVSTAQHLLR